MKKLVLILLMLVSIGLFAESLTLPDFYNKSKVKVSGWSVTEKETDLNKDGKDDILVIHYKEEDGNVVTYYTAYVNQSNGTYKRYAQTRKVFTRDAFGKEFGTFTQDFINNYENYVLDPEKNTTEKKENTYFVKLFYDESDETEMVIRLLSFGPMIKVIEPLEFKQLIRQRLKKQKAYSI